MQYLIGGRAQQRHQHAHEAGRTLLEKRDLFEGLVQLEIDADGLWGG